MSVEDVHQQTKIDPWFLDEIQQIVRFEGQWVSTCQAELGSGLKAENPIGLPEAVVTLLLQAKKLGFADQRLGQLIGRHEDWIRQVRQNEHGNPVTVFKRVDTCGGEFEAHTPYLYSSAGSSCEAHPTQQRKIMILGGGPNRIGQGIEFDYCCVHAAMALR
jgi:carbamoyl-phosphate synthase large subunit